MSKGIGNYKGSPAPSQNFMNFGPQTPKNRTVIFTILPKILHFASLPGLAHEDQLAHGDQEMELN